MSENELLTDLLKKISECINNGRCETAESLSKIYQRIKSVQTKTLGE